MIMYTHYIIGIYGIKQTISAFQSNGVSNTCLEFQNLWTEDTMYMTEIVIVLNLFWLTDRADSN